MLGLHQPIKFRSKQMLQYCQSLYRKTSLSRFPVSRAGVLFIGPRQNITVSPIVKDSVDDTEVEGIKSGQQGKGLYAWGIFTYEDIFGKPQYPRFCHLYTWLADGKTTWDYDDNRHNDAS
jgi:hypothetical protein